MIASSSSGPKVVLPTTTVFESVESVAVSVDADDEFDAALPPPPPEQAARTTSATTARQYPCPVTRLIAGETTEGESTSVPRRRRRARGDRRRLGVHRDDGCTEGHRRQSRPFGARGLRAAGVDRRRRLAQFGAADAGGPEGQGGPLHLW